MERIKTNIVEINKLYIAPCKDWIKRRRELVVNGKIDIHQAFIEYGEEYEWLYENSPYDLIGWEIENGCFNWEEHSQYVALFCPEYIPGNEDKYNWEKNGKEIAEYCPKYFDKERFNWKKDSAYIAVFYPELFDSEKFNWKKYSWVVAQHCPQFLDPNKYNWEKYSWDIAQYCPQHLDPTKYNWEKHSWAVARFCPDKIVPELFNWDDIDVMRFIENYKPELLKLKPKNQ
ncbi:MAG: hypothetical protein LDL10_00990 [Calditerrivibrio sp.]|nr:hypothetical protein [Calditerrivibrio sp.]